MEVLRIPGYLESEKVQIASRFLLPRQLRATGLAPGDLAIPEETLVAIVRGYTREAGVRNLEREIAALCRRAARAKAGGAGALPAGLRRRRAPAGAGLGLELLPGHLEPLLGAPQRAEAVVDRPSRVGVATGLAWTEAGGELLVVEVGVLPGRGNLILTGSLGPTLRESAQAALSYIRSRVEVLGIDPGFHRRSDIHVHLPEGSVPKDGPSAGAAIALAMVSALTGVATRSDAALSGEVTLRGNVLPVGGLAEKVVAARRAGILTLLLPSRNLPHYNELPDDLRRGLAVGFVDSMDEVLARGLDSPLAARAA
jgi:ATP-dependent Lon protease